MNTNSPFFLDLSIVNILPQFVWKFQASWYFTPKYFSMQLLRTGMVLFSYLTHNGTINPRVNPIHSPYLNSPIVPIMSFIAIAHPLIQIQRSSVVLGCHLGRGQSQNMGWAWHVWGIGERSVSWSEVGEEGGGKGEVRGVGRSQST